MKKTAPTEFPILPAIADRWSPRAFSSQPVEEEKLNRIFEAARWAPSCNNEQPWIFIVSHHGTEGFERMADCLLAGNSWAKKAGVLALSVARTTFTRTGKSNIHGMYDTGGATVQMAIQAEAEGLFVHQMAGYDFEKARKVLHIPADHQPCAMMAIGYYGNPASLNDSQREREVSPRQRNPQTTFVFMDAMPAANHDTFTNSHE